MLNISERELYLNISVNIKLFNEIFYSIILIMTSLGTWFLIS